MVLVIFEKHVLVYFIFNISRQWLNVNFFGLIYMIYRIWWVCWRDKCLLFLIIRTCRRLIIILTKFPFILFAFICRHFFGSILNSVRSSFRTTIFDNLALILHLVLFILFNWYSLHGWLIIWSKAIVQKITHCLSLSLIKLIFFYNHKGIVFVFILLSFFICWKDGCHYAFFLRFNYLRGRLLTI